ncbi:hypothetical protein [Philodulcilactobacillus myokoensis]|uniref:hypothetical protein n=1 Tax=Philodulcilactobacillus myokoensis TaxID=2929573 RepID=UPI00256FD119|nr:hypothetical protein [Philodulcilactobacillus myokoensis]
MIGLIINAMGNGFTIVSNFGSGIWTAAAVNIHNITGFQVGILIFCFGILNTITNQFLIQHLDIVRLIEEIVYISFFSYMVNWFTNLFTSWELNQWSPILRIPMSIMGVTLFCIAISLYQRANLFMHPNDDTTNILRFKYMHGSAIFSQLTDMLPPIVIIIICFFITGKVYSVNVGTIYSIIFNGMLIATADKYVWKSLIHNFKPSENISN